MPFPNSRGIKAAANPRLNGLAWPCQNCIQWSAVLTGVEGTGPPTGDRPCRWTAGRVVACEERRIGDGKIGAGQGQARVPQQSEARTEQDRCYTAAQYLREAESESL